MAARRPRSPSLLSTSARLATAVLLASVAACGGSSRNSPVLAPQDASQRLDGLIAQDRRVAEVAWRLATANQELCPVVRPRPGWSLHAANQYGPAMRPIVERRFGLEGDLPGVLATPVGAPAAVSGLGAGDVITAVNGAGLTIGSASAPAGFDGLQANLAVLDAAAAQGAMTLTVRRDGHDRIVTVQSTPACAYTTQIDAMEGLSGRSDGRRVFISSGLVALARTDDELAFFLAHELAHAVLEHRTAADVVGARGTANSQISLRRGRSSRAEADADVMGLYLLARAGYDPHAAVEALSAYAAASPLSRYAQISLTGGDIYQPPEVRRRALAPVLVEITRRRLESEPLIP